MKNEKTLKFKRGVIVFLCFMLYKLALDYAWENMFYIFSRGLQPIRPESALYITWVFYVVQVILFIALVVSREDLLSVMFGLLFVLSGVGFYSLYGFKTNMTFQGYLYGSLFWMLFTVAVGIMPRKGKAGQLPVPEEQKSSIQDSPIKNGEYILFAACAIITLAISGVYANFRIFIRFEDVYSYRADFGELGMPRLVSYAFRWLTGVFVPYFFVRFLAAKRWLFAAFALLCGMFLYGVEGLKTTLVIYLIIGYFFLVFIRKKEMQPHKIYIAISLILTAGMTIGVWLYKATGEYYYNTQLFRVLIIPANIADNYYLYIVDREALLLRESIMRIFAKSPYPKSIMFLVSSASNVVANTGLFGDAYANFKLVGVITYPFVYSAVLYKWQDICDQKINMVAVSLGFIMVWNAINLSFFTWLLTGGVLIFFILPKLLKVRT